MKIKENRKRTKNDCYGKEESVKSENIDWHFTEGTVKFEKIEWRFANELFTVWFSDFNEMFCKYTRLSPLVFSFITLLTYYLFYKILF